MGLSISSAKFLTKAWKDGVCFKNTLTLGRQHMLIKSERARAILKQYGAWPPPQGESAFLQAVGTEFPWAFNTFARALGAERISACDASSYEGADYTHDLNLPVPSELEETFDLVIDGGTLEHVFNFPTAMANCMKMVKTGGHLVIFTPINNYCGHGFYQFSPELFYRVFSSENGFEVSRMVAVADDVGIGSFFGLRYYFPITGPWYEVMDPAKIGKIGYNPHKPGRLYHSHFVRGLRLVLDGEVRPGKQHAATHSTAVPTSGVPGEACPRNAARVWCGAMPITDTKVGWLSARRMPRSNGFVCARA